MKFLFLVLMFMSSSAFAGRGGMVGNGGDAILQEFNLRGIQLAAYLRSEPTVAAKFGIDAERFLNVVKTTALAGEDHLILNGVEVDAINYPIEMAIEVSRTRWAASATRMDAYFVQRRIALHEYLWIYGIDDTGYSVSNPIIAEIEKASAPVMDPQVRDMLLGRLCDKVSASDLAGARAMLSWGLDLNQKCPSDRNATPFQFILKTYWDWKHQTPELETARLELVRAMLTYGADPNQGDFPFNDSPSILVTAITQDTDFGLALLDFGANPNWTSAKGDSAFAFIAGRSGSQNLDVRGFEGLLKAGADVNFSENKEDHITPARMIAMKSDNAAVVEALLKSGKADWCTPHRTFWFPRAIDAVLADYKPLFAKYGVQCPRFRQTVGTGKTCEEAKVEGRKSCTDNGFAYAIPFSPVTDPTDCYSIEMGDASGATHTQFNAVFNCQDEPPAH